MTSMELHNIMEEADQVDGVERKSESDRFETPGDETPKPSRKSGSGGEVVSNGGMYENDYDRVDPSAPLPESDDSGPPPPYSSDRYLRCY